MKSPAKEQNSGKSMKGCIPMDENILIDVEFISIWDGNRIIESTASVDMDTKEVFDIEDDGSDDGDFCMERHIVIDEEEYPVVPKSSAKPGDFWFDDD